MRLKIQAHGDPDARDPSGLDTRVECANVVTYEGAKSAAEAAEADVCVIVIN